MKSLLFSDLETMCSGILRQPQFGCLRSAAKLMRKLLSALNLWDLACCIVLFLSSQLSAQITPPALYNHRMAFNIVRGQLV